MILKRKLNTTAVGVAPGLGLLWLLCAVSTASAQITLTVNLFNDTAPSAQGSPEGAGDGPGVQGDLRWSILQANAIGTGNPGTITINFNCGAPPCTIALGAPLPPITSNLTIDGGTTGNVILDGAGAWRVFFADTGTITLANLVIRNANATGANGAGGGGGGGAGFGAGLFVNRASAEVTVRNTYFFNCSATGGNGDDGFTGGPSGGVLGRGQVAGRTGGDNSGAGGGGAGLCQLCNGPSVDGGSPHATSDAGGSPVFGVGGFGGGGGGGARFLSGGGAGGHKGGTGGFGGGGGGSAGGSGGDGGGCVGTVGGGGGSGSGASGASRGGSGNGCAQNGGSSGAGGGGAAAGPAIFVNEGSVVIAKSAGSAFSSKPGRGGGQGDSSGKGGDGSADSTPVFNYGGTVNGSKAVGGIAGALSDTISVTIATTPGNPEIFVSGQPGCAQGIYTSPVTLQWSAGAVCAVEIIVDVSAGAPYRYNFTGWTDGNVENPRTFSSPTPGATYTANVKTQYLLVLEVAGGAGSVSGAGYYDAGTTATIVGTPAAGYVFGRWAGNVDNQLSASTTVLMNDVQLVGAAFFAKMVQVTVGTSPPGLSFIVDGTSYTNQAAVVWSPGSQHTIATTSSQSGGQYVFGSWSGGATDLSLTVTAPYFNLTQAYTAYFNASTNTNITAPSISYGANGVVTVGVTALVGGTVAGSVALSVDSGTPLSMPLTNGSATFTLPGLTGGSHSLLASFAAQGGYAASSATGSLMVGQVSQMITFSTSPPPSAAYGTSFTVSATGGASGLAVTFASGGACSNNGATYHMDSGAGTCSVIANQAGNANYTPATQVNVSVIATPALQVITFSTSPPPSATYGSSFGVAATGGASGNAVTFMSGGACGNNGAAYTMTSGTGTCLVTANQPGNTNYAPATTVTQTVGAPTGRFSR